MPLQITIQDPSYYLERLETGCILDPSIFYSSSHVEAATQLLLEIEPRNVYLPSNLLKAQGRGDWSSFMSTLTLWSGDFEKLPSAWYQSDALVEQLRPMPIEIRPEDEDEKVNALRQAMSEKGPLTPLYRILFEISACSLQKSVPILVASHSRIRLLELLNSKLQTVIVEPLGKWSEDKNRFLRQNRRRPVIFALGLMGGAFVFIESVLSSSILPMAGTGMLVIATVIDGR